MAGSFEDALSSLLAELKDLVIAEHVRFNIATKLLSATPENSSALCLNNLDTLNGDCLAEHRQPQPNTIEMREKLASRCVGTTTTRADKCSPTAFAAKTKDQSMHADGGSISAGTGRLSPVCFGASGGGKVQEITSWPPASNSSHLPSLSAYSNQQLSLPALNQSSRNSATRELRFSATRHHDVFVSETNDSHLSMNTDKSDSLKLIPHELLDYADLAKRHTNRGSICQTQFSIEDQSSQKSKREAVDTSLRKLTKRKQSQTPKFDLFMGCMILVNMIVIALSLQLDGLRLASESGIDVEYTEWEGIQVTFLIAEHLFCVSFAAELVFRLCCNGFIYLKEALGFFEAVLVVLNIFELYILGPLDLGSGTNFTVLRITRLFRLARVMRMVRVLSLFSSLRLLTKTIVSCLTSLAWSMTLLGLIVIATGLMVCSLVRDSIGDMSLDPEVRSWLFKNYGTSTNAVYTIFEATLSGCWPNYARPLISEVNGLWCWFWVLYVSAVVFAIISVIRAIFLKETLQNALGDPDAMIAEQLLKKSAYCQKLGEAFMAIDLAGGGGISQEDFEWTMNLPSVRAFLDCLDFQVHDAEFVFHMLESDNDGVITNAEFLQGIMRLKGAARQVDVVSIQRDCSYLLQAVLALTRAFESALNVKVKDKVDVRLMSVCTRGTSSDEVVELVDRKLPENL